MGSTSGGKGISFHNCYVTGSVTDNSGVVINGLSSQVEAELVENSYYIDTTTGQITVILSGKEQLVTKTELDELIAQGILPAYRVYSNLNSGSTSATGVNLTLQVGINSSDSSQIGVSIAPLDISALDGLDMSSTNALSTIDGVLKTINDQQTNLGAIENRLESALEQIGVAYDNLVSTQSTIRDADVEEESSAYIRNQILQQAAATLMATANQTPSIALQLL